LQQTIQSIIGVFSEILRLGRALSFMFWFFCHFVSLLLLILNLDGRVDFFLSLKWVILSKI
jgi:hypothetical protein